MQQYFQARGHSFSPYGPPNRQRTYIYEPLLLQRVLRQRIQILDYIQMYSVQKEI